MLHAVLLRIVEQDRRVSLRGEDDEEKLLRTVVGRPQEGSTSFVTGGDVSRFQRRTMPAQTAPAAAPPSANGQSAAPVRQGPVVRVTRGQTTTVESVDKKATALVAKQADAMGGAASTVSLGAATLR